MGQKCTKTTFTIFLFLVSAGYAHASVVINEIMYNLDGTDSKREWIEVHNAGSDSVDLSNWKLFENGTNHGLSPVASGSVPPDGYAVIADDPSGFKGDWPQYQGILFDSSFSLSNSGETLTLRDENLVDQDMVSYTSDEGANGDGNSLQKVGSRWVAAPPTPGAANVTVGSSAATSSDSTTTATHATSTEDAAGYSVPGTSSFAVKPDIIAGAGGDRTVVVGAPARFDGQAYGLKRIPMTSARYDWTMGDGGTAYGQHMLYTYLYPGTYAVVLNVSSGRYAASDKITVTAIPATVTIADTKAGPGGYVALSNKGDSTVDLSGWSLHADSAFFVFPPDTEILPHSKALFPAAHTGLVLSGSPPVSLLYPNGTTATTSISSTGESKTSPVAIRPKVSAGQKPSVPLPPHRTDPQSVLRATTTTATTTGSDLPKAQVLNGTSSTGIPWWIYALLGITTAGVLGALVTGTSTQQVLSPVEIADAEAADYEIIEDDSDEEENAFFR